MKSYDGVCLCNRSCTLSRVHIFYRNESEAIKDVVRAVTPLLEKIYGLGKIVKQPELEFAGVASKKNISIQNVLCPTTRPPPKSGGTALVSCGIWFLEALLYLLLICGF